MEENSSRAEKRKERVQRAVESGERTAWRHTYRQEQREGSN